MWIDPDFCEHDFSALRSPIVSRDPRVSTQTVYVLGAPARGGFRGAEEAVLAVTRQTPTVSAAATQTGCPSERKGEVERTR